MIDEEATEGKYRALALLAGAQLLVLTLWFSASAVAPQLEDLWGLSTGQTAWLTLSVQLGFVAGALALAIAGITDRFPARWIFAVCGVLAAGANGALLTVDADSVTLAFVLRFLTGAFIAGVYPMGMKMMAGWFRAGRGMAIGVMVGALIVGSAGPHLIKGIGLDWRGVVTAVSVLALIGVALVAAGVSDGPYESPPSPFRWSRAVDVARDEGTRLATYGYFGHMWELFAMWTWTATFLSESAARHGSGDGWVPVATFAVIAAGGPASWLLGIAADRIGRTRAAGAALVVSGLCALLTPLVFGATPWVTVVLFFVWGASVSPDSPQFSVMVTETAAPADRGTALTLQTALGFLLTIVTIRGVPVLVDWIGWRWAFPWLALGPLFGVVAMVRLRRSPASARLTGEHGRTAHSGGG